MSTATTRPDGLHVRNAGPDDLTTIVAFNLALASETESKVLDPVVLDQGVRKALAEPDRLRYWVAVSADSGQVVGQSAVTREWSDWRNGWIWWFQSVYVHPDARSRGVFRALYAHIRETAREEGGVVGLRLYVEVDNDRAQCTYAAMGMVPGGYHVYEEMWPERSSGESGVIPRLAP